jgi:uncharacterized protein YndB with AHSA1/START domain
MRDYGVVTEPGTIRFERMLPGPIERVWAYLTEPEKRKTWLAGGRMDLRVGGEVELDFNHAHLVADPGPIPEKYRQYEAGSTTRGRITRCEPPRALSYTWEESSGDKSEVSFELAPRGQQVQLVLTHSKLNNRGETIGVAGGWHTHLDILIEHLSGQQPPAFWPAHMKMEEERTAHPVIIARSSLFQQAILPPAPQGGGMT